jgi:hypothetical protein
MSPVTAYLSISGFLADAVFVLELQSPGSQAMAGKATT